MTNEVRYKGDNSQRLHSMSFWRPDLIKQIKKGTVDGYYFFDDFNSGGVAENSTAFAWTGGTPAERYLSHGTASSTIKRSNAAADDEIGVLLCDIDADNDEAYVTFDSVYAGAFGKISDTAGDNRPLWFEARCRFKNVASSSATVAKMVGLRANVAAATLDIPDGGATIKVEEFVGFRAVSGDGDGMDTVYVDNAEVVHTEAADDSNLVIAADEWNKFGLYFDGTKLYYYVNGVKIGDGVLPSATNFPDAEPLKPYFGGRLDGSDTANEIHLDWWSFMRLDGLCLQP